MTELGRADCNECEGEGTRYLIINQMGVWSRCRRCGFSEWEWSYGDRPDYLKRLAEKYDIDYKTLAREVERT